ncbi:MAG: hypothetical protein ACM3S1_16425 [Hyphomicrobiales bacterium]
MDQEYGPAPAVRPPIALGCLGMVAALVFLIGFGFVAIKYLESGTQSKVVLDDVDSYGRGTVEFVGERNIFVVRLADGTFLALNDLDEANRANPGHRCRVSPIPINDPSLPGILEEYRSSFSPKAAGTTLVFRETCNNALYDVTGVRLDAEGLNLTRHDVDINEAGKLTVNMATKRCTQREGDDFFAPVDCPSD